MLVNFVIIHLTLSQRNSCEVDGLDHDYVNVALTSDASSKLINRLSIIQCYKLARSVSPCIPNYDIHLLTTAKKKETTTTNYDFVYALQTNIVIRVD